ncbi:pheromone a factor receptor [Fusarium langsethiae]|uniref:Pheromone a factor receptor n=1 Tax=Fusarium langsethiae TaxID=179993 RepID=A0A0M9F3T2_FUSLA|nr:pheromone a factor receptor [Fusarium langsethiae]GKT99462.1 unnamed protein product [Fusarium langsethiae]GKU17505.1 unnamed protein product [Fusarium langsethiae]
MTDSIRLFGRDDLSIIAAPGPGTTTTPSLTANLVCRVLFGIISNLACIVPLKNLYRNGEFAAVVFIANIELANLDTIINALIWRNDDTSKWWSGQGLCDISPYYTNFLNALFGTCLLAIMRNLAQQVGLLRANPLSVQEKRRRNLVQALIMFPLPIIQITWVWPLTTQRYAVATLVGCSWIAWPAWPYMTFFVIAPVIVALITSGYAILTYIRFRQIARTTRTAINSSRSANQRAQRTKRRLYLMVLAILIPYLPVVVTLAVLNMLGAFPLQPFDYDLIHNRTWPYPWSAVILVPSNGFTFIHLNNCYIDILAAIPVVLFFGMTKDAINSYRRGLLYFGLGHLFPKLQETSSASLNPVSLQPTHSATTPEVEIGHGLGELQISQSRLRETVYPALSPSPSTNPITLPPRNPFLFRTRFDLLTIPIPSLPSFNFKRKKDRRPPLDRGLPLDSLPSVVNGRMWEDNSPAQPPRNQTLVWADAEDTPTPDIIASDTRLLVPILSTYSVTTEPL